MLQLNERETATVLAALRLWQRHIENDQFIDDVAGIATEEGKFEALTPDEIEALCERVNIDGEPCIWLNTGEVSGEITMHLNVKLFRDRYGSGDPAVVIEVEEGETRR